MFKESSDKVYKIIKILISIVTKYKQTLKIRRFYKKNFSFKQSSTKIILIEAFQVPSNEISILYFLKSLRSKKDFTPVAFYFNEMPNQNMVLNIKSIPKNSIAFQFKNGKWLIKN